MSKQNIGVVGLAVMGKNLALNIADHGYTVSVLNRSRGKTEEFLAELPGEPGAERVQGHFTVEEFVRSLERPRKIILMVKAGRAVDDTIDQLLPHLSQGDIIVDGGNSHFVDTIRRSETLEAAGLHYLGVGISGGEEGARTGPAIMPGGDEGAYRFVEPILTAISAKVEGEPCCRYIGPDGAGHFVKMVHNGIEYADMQLICEAYLILKTVLGMTPPDLHRTFTAWNEGELSSYLIGITADIFTKRDTETDGYLVDMILDVAGQKGTGKWTSQVALDLGVPTPTITEAVFQRYLSADRPLRQRAGALYSAPAAPQKEAADFVEAVRGALYASKICAYAQGFGLMMEASRQYGWNLDLAGIAKIFRGGCIIRAQFLDGIAAAYEADPALLNLLLAPTLQKAVEDYHQAWREVVAAAVLAGIPVPGFASAIAYFDSLRAQGLPMNLLQAQRDYFGAHTYQRTDRTGSFHTQW